jgi:DNA primase
MSAPAVDLTNYLAEVRARVPLISLIGGHVKLRRAGRLWKGCCPFHAEKTPSFSVWPDHYHCFGCGAHGDAINWAMRTCGLNFSQAVRYLTGSSQLPPINENTLRRPVVAHTDDRASVEWAERIWRESVSPEGTLAERYLQSRGLDLPSGIACPEQSAIRFHPALWHRESRRKWPAMVAVMVEPMSGLPTGVHRTWLKPDGLGKAPVVCPKMTLGPLGVIRLYAWQGDGLGVSEGIETGLAVAQHFEWQPIWAAGSTTMMGRLPILSGVALTIFADNDANKAGTKAADACAQKWANSGAEVWIRMPPPGDWDDVKDVWRT